MAKGYLKINVYGENIANPIRNAKVTIYQNEEIIDEIFTNENGTSETISLETVDKEYSEEEQYLTVPYQTYDILVESLGLTPLRINGIQIYDNITSIQNVYLNSIDNEKQTENIELPPNTLWGDYPSIIDEDTSADENIAPYVLKEVIIPANIIVHDGIPSNTNAANYTVPFVDYIKNVASSEIYATWPSETIKANVLAIISFTLNRIYTEWYKSCGYDFTITSTTTYDQKYTRNGTIYNSISKIVDEIFTNYIRSGYRMEPLLAHYKNNTTESGYLSQWGSKELGDKGYNALQILKYYYGNDINIYEADTTTNYPYSFTSTLKQGDCSSDVYFLQNALNYIHSSYPGIPLIENPSGYYDTNTTNAIKNFQKVFSLNQTGEANFETWYKISYILTAVQNLTESLYQ